MTQTRMSRRTLLSAIGLGGSALLLAACQAPKAAEPTAAAKAPTSAPAPTAAAAAAPKDTAPTAAPATANADWQKQWDELVAGAKKEGTVIVSGPPTQQVRQDLPKAFKDRF